MLALDVRQHQGAGDSVEHVSGWRNAAPLFEPRVPSRTDVGALRNLLAAQAEGTATLRRKTERGRIELRPTVPEIGAEWVFRRLMLAHPVSNLTMMRSLLYQNTIWAESCLEGNL